MAINESSLILAIESSCDETSVAVIENGSIIRSNIVASQIKSHQRFGGVVPEVASRHHVEQISQVLDLALDEAELSIEAVDAIAVTQGPGLVGALLVGITAAKTLAFVHQKPLIGVNHLAGHIYASQLVTPLRFPLIALVVSGGHTELVYMPKDGCFEVIGETQDDAVGEAYDKVGRILDLPYPAGKYLDQLAQEGQDTYSIPRAMIHEENLDFSFSGMKSAVMNLVHNANQRGETVNQADLATSFQSAAVEVLTDKARRALEAHPEVQQFILAGGVAANSGLRGSLTDLLARFPKVELTIPPLSLCGDNAAMIGAAADYLYREGQFSDLAMNAHPGQAIDEPFRS
ncbi:tRNA (adenosine(37)-N6)-threonylcarbamoyltransferase complex transferase subunit TsaD [Hutsoniella sourekii]|uniref:tRNA (adenosine(37)-N6)-threonylcarbamoyltransferase complex transferase subunit TsaD n=1 Tax=Hutsoniella sourekii TaxID=87650 RepID=UPI0004B6633D|nr:tRNA (adenosine(37)-N6)-threonylcarbamoyltransferase complex transferase subunit TsaD [Hutsoniella sourekii]